QPLGQRGHLGAQAAAVALVEDERLDARGPALDLLAVGVALAVGPAERVVARRRQRRDRGFVDVLDPLGLHRMSLAGATQGQPTPWARLRSRAGRPAPATARLCAPPCL